MRKKKNLGKLSQKRFKKRHGVFTFFIFFLLLTAIILSLLSKYYPYFPFDILITKNIQSINFFWFQELMKLITYIGNPFPGFIIVIVIVGFLFFKLKSRETLFLLFSTCGAVVISMFLKVLILRPRPTPDLVMQVGYFVNRDSFPSGHVLFYIGLFGFLAYLFYVSKIRSPLRKSLLIFLTILLFSIGLSRIYLGAHWFSDVMGAYIIGLLWLIVVINFYRKVKLNLILRKVTAFKL